MASFLMDNSRAPINWEPKNIRERILQNAKNLLMTQMGDVPYDRRRGISREVEHKPLPHVQQHIRQEMDRVMAWEPDIAIKKVIVTQESDGLRIACEVEEPLPAQDQARINL